MTARSWTLRAVIFCYEKFSMRHRKYHSPAVAISAGLWYNTDKESAVWQTVSTFPADQQKMTAQIRTLGRSFFVMKDLIRYVECAEAHRCKQREQSQNL